MIAYAFAFFYYTIVTAFFLSLMLVPVIIVWQIFRKD